MTFYPPKKALTIFNDIIKRELDIQFDTHNGLDINMLNEEVIDALVNAGMIKTCWLLKGFSKYDDLW